MSDISDNVELPNQPVPDTGKRDLEYYARILEEASSIKGTSLWQDAWKQLKRNRAAMVSLVFLILLAVLAFSDLPGHRTATVVRTKLECRSTIS